MTIDKFVYECSIFCQLHSLFQHLIHSTDCIRICRIIGTRKQIRHLVRRHTLIQFGHEFLCIHSHHPFFFYAAFSYISRYRSVMRSIPASSRLNAVAREIPITSYSSSTRTSSTYRLTMISRSFSSSRSIRLFSCQSSACLTASLRCSLRS